MSYYLIENASNPIAGADIKAGQVIKMGVRVSDGKRFRVPVGVNEGFTDQGIPYGVAVRDAKAGSIVEVAVDGIIGVLASNGSEDTDITAGDFLFSNMQDATVTPEPYGEFNIIVGQALGDLDVEQPNSFLVPVRLSFTPFFPPVEEGEDP